MLYLDQIIRYKRKKELIVGILDMIDSKHSRSRLCCVWYAKEE